MARAVSGEQSNGDGKKAWLSRADAVKSKVPNTGSYRHAKSAAASVERVRELAGVIKLSKPAPSKKFIGK